ncbi:methylated-DNA--[protein]-cysteine S-methyltransferase [Neiella sp. HB171785]|uniref:methylated-DNA--[protein]-cysteine S-methyltransferase n=2 Tax=Neiella litorisoli TaxID=2771431 RepID=A0A8J6QT05_9GAMM|nr:methylated-DNA--[protein]-cysteine S-methyltransferase [Neiella litorisoli]MBD1391356.1 methylated-DNA--[protein]-cysteine S-methyltransferase [Neiella litorisoli]
MIAVVDPVLPHSPLIRLEFEDSFRGDLSAAAPAANHPMLRETQQQLNDYFATTRHAFSLPIAPTGTPFQQSVWQALLAIPYGNTRSYTEQATLVGNRKAVRAVGAANGRNPIAIVIPCHRVVASSGQLTGYAGGILRKQQLLALECKPEQYHDKPGYQQP